MGKEIQIKWKTFDNKYSHGMLSGFLNKMTVYFNGVSGKATIIVPDDIKVPKSFVKYYEYIPSYGILGDYISEKWEHLINTQYSENFRDLLSMPNEKIIKDLNKIAKSKKIGKIKDFTIQQAIDDEGVEEIVKFKDNVYKLSKITLFKYVPVADENQSDTNNDENEQ